MYYLGIDGSSNVTRIIASDENGKIFCRHTGNSINFAVNSLEAVNINIFKLVTEFNRIANTKISDCIAVCIGLAGIVTLKSSEDLQGIMKNAGFDCPIAVVNDHELILASETEGKAGVLVIAGNSSIAIAFDRNGNLQKAGGYGPIIDDGGSSYWIGIQALKYALMASDGRFPETMLSKTICEHFNLNKITDVVDYIYSDTYSKQKVCELLLLVNYAAKLKDEAALLIEENAAVELYKLANSLITRYKLEDTTLVVSGSVLILNENIQKRFSDLLTDRYDNLKITKVKAKSEIGAIYIAKRLGHKTEA